jgi:hypothetical protein
LRGLLEAEHLVQKSHRQQPAAAAIHRRTVHALDSAGGIALDADEFEQAGLGNQEASRRRSPPPDRE